MTIQMINTLINKFTVIIGLIAKFDKDTQNVKFIVNADKIKQLFLKTKKWIHTIFYYFYIFIFYFILLMAIF